MRLASCLVVGTGLTALTVAAQGAPSELCGRAYLMDGRVYQGIIEVAEFGVVDGAGIDSDPPITHGYMSVIVHGREAKVPFTDIASAEAKWVPPNAERGIWHIETITITRRDGTQIVGAPHWILFATTVRVRQANGSIVRAHSFSSTSPDFDPGGLLVRVELETSPAQGAVPPALSPTSRSKAAEPPAPMAGAGVQEGEFDKRDKRTTAPETPEEAPLVRWCDSTLPSLQDIYRAAGYECYGGSNEEPQPIPGFFAAAEGRLVRFVALMPAPGVENGHLVICQVEIRLRRNVKETQAASLANYANSRSAVAHFYATAAEDESMQLNARYSLLVGRLLVAEELLALDHEFEREVLGVAGDERLRAKIRAGEMP